MASGDTLAVLLPQAARLTATNVPARANYGAAGVMHDVLDFDDTTSESAMWDCVMPVNFGGAGSTGLTVTAVWRGATGNGSWTGAFERHEDDVTAMNADQFGTAYGSGTVASASAATEPQYSTIPFTTSGGQYDGILAGESFRFRLAYVRPGSSPISGDISLHRVIITET